MLIPRKDLTENTVSKQHLMSLNRFLLLQNLESMINKELEQALEEPVKQHIVFNANRDLKIKSLVGLRPHSFALAHAKTVDDLIRLQKDLTDNDIDHFKKEGIYSSQDLVVSVKSMLQTAILNRTFEDVLIDDLASAGYRFIFKVNFSIKPDQIDIIFPTKQFYVKDENV